MLNPRLFSSRAVRIRILGGALLCIVVVVSLLVFWRHQVASDTDMRAEQSHWQDRINVVGGKTAYEEFAASIASSPVKEQHESAHIFGEALYAGSGARGVSVCDHRFSGGCFHQFIGEAMTREGTAVVRELVAACISLHPVTGSIFCAHGIGHGLTAYLGYERTDLTGALTGCDLFQDDYFRGSCYNGVFMEYEERTVLGPDAVGMPFKGNWYEPCDSLVDNLERSLCFFHQPKWWWNMLTGRGEKAERIAKRMGELCTTTDPSVLDVCFRGIGSTFGLKADESVAASLCTYTSSDPALLLVCSKATARTLVEAGRSPLESCGYLLPSQRTECETYARATSTGGTAVPSGM